VNYRHCHHHHHYSHGVTSVMQMYRSHLKEVLHYQYPDHYGIVLKLLLQGLCHYHSSLHVFSRSVTFLVYPSFDYHVHFLQSLCAHFVLHITVSCSVANLCIFLHIRSHLCIQLCPWPSPFLCHHFQLMHSIPEKLSVQFSFLVSSVSFLDLCRSGHFLPHCRLI